MANEGIKGSNLVPGKLYTLCGNSKSYTGTWPAYHNRPKLNQKNNAVNHPLYPLYPLEPFVFLERLMSDFRYSDSDPMYDYKILTCNGTICWLSLHDDDLRVFGIYFRECHSRDFEENL